MDSINAINAALLLGSLLVLAGIFSSMLARKFGAPLLLVFLAVGMLAGEDGPGNIQFNDYELTYLIGSLALAIILFDGGLRAKLSTFQDALAPSLVLATFGVVLTAVLTGAFAYLVLDLTILESLLLGSIVASTDAAAVFFLLNSGGLQLRQRINSVLEIESGTNDPVAVILTIALTQIVLLQGRDINAFEFAKLLFMQGGIGTVTGISAGMAAATLLNRISLPSGLHPLFVVASAIATYAFTSTIGGSGFLAVYLAGLTLGNRPIRAYPSIAAFHDAATWLSQIIMFLVLGLLVTPSTLLTYAVPGLMIAAFLIVVARPLMVWACISPFKFRESEKAFISWVGLRGAVSIFLAAIPTLSGVEGAETFFNVAFFVVLVSLLVQGWTIAPAARRLGIASPQRTPAVDRVELDLPGQLDFELVGYPIHQDSPIARHRLRLPPLVSSVLVVRREEILTPEAAGRLEPGDYAYFICPPGRIARLDRLIAVTAPGASPAATFGEFVIAPGARITEVAALYDLTVDTADVEDTVAEAFARHFDGRPMAGDQIPLGEMGTLVARKVENDQVTGCTLQLDEMMEAAYSPGIGRLRQALMRRLRAAGAALAGKPKRPGP